MTVTTAVLAQLREALSPGSVDLGQDRLNGASHDAWPVAVKWNQLGQHPHPADVFVSVRTEAEVTAVLAIARASRTPVTTRALGSSVTGQPLPVRGGIVLDVSGLIGEPLVDEIDLTVTVPAGTNGGKLEDELNAAGWTLRFSPQSLYRSSVGGWLSTLATGQFSSRYGGIEDAVVGYRVVLSTGETVAMSTVPRAAVGPDLRQLFLGAEGTLGVITQVTLRIWPLPAAQLLQAYRMPALPAGLAVMREQAALGLRPFLLRFYDEDETRHALADPTASSPVLFAGTEGDPDVAAAELAALSRLAIARGGQELGPAPVQSWLQRRFDFSAVEDVLATAGGYAETIEVAHGWRSIEGLHRRLKAALAPMADQVLAHFSHVYPQGTSMYLILLGQAADDAEAAAVLQQIWQTTMEICLAEGAQLSHHHGAGLARSPYVERSIGPAHTVLRRVKAALDPASLLNPGKLGL